MTVAQLLASLSSKEFSEWMIFDKLEPFGEHRADLRSGMAMSPLINEIRGMLNPKPKLTSPSDWLLKFQDAPAKVTPQKPEDMKAVLVAMRESWFAEERLKKKRTERKANKAAKKVKHV